MKGVGVTDDILHLSPVQCERCRIRVQHRDLHPVRLDFNPAREKLLHRDPMAEFLENIHRSTAPHHGESPRR
jgi:hypothetical protein